jgi:hypothetical protein
VKYSAIVNEKAPIDKCPYCGSVDGYYTKQQAYGPCTRYYNFDGSFCDNSTMHDFICYKGGKIAYCVHCDKRLFKVEE